MKKAIMLAVVATMMAAVCPVDAATSSSGSGPGDKMKNGFKAVGKGIMWGPHKIGDGFKSLKNKMSGNKSSSKSK